MWHECIDYIIFIQPILLKNDEISPSLLITTQLLKTQYQTIKQIASALIESSILICDDINTHMIANSWSISIVSNVEQISDLTALLMTGWY
jgi:hypothetical protein